VKKKPGLLWGLKTGAGLSGAEDRRAKKLTPNFRTLHPVPDSMFVFSEPCVEKLALGSGHWAAGRSEPRRQGCWYCCQDAGAARSLWNGTSRIESNFAVGVMFPS
jgi:hypothetical protein